jgi:hypothetical protein
VEEKFGRERCDRRRGRADRLCYDTLDVISAREKSSFRGVAAAWIVAGIAAMALFVWAAISPATLRAPPESQERLQAAH